MNDPVLLFICRKHAVNETQVFKTKIIQVMKLRIIIIGLLILSSFIGVRAQDKCPNVVVVRKTLYDSFQRARGSVENLERELTRDRQVLDDLRLKYRDCEHQTDIGAMLTQQEDAVKNLEDQLKAVR